MLGHVLTCIIGACKQIVFQANPVKHFTKVDAGITHGYEIVFN